MRLKTFTAANTREAMELVRSELGEDAIIVSTQRGPGGHGVRITAALDAAEPELAAANDSFNGLDPIEIISNELDRHGVPLDLAERVMSSFAMLDSVDPVTALAAAFDERFSFAPLPKPETARNIILLGMPGAGKTLMTAKLAARAVLGGHGVTVITTDTLRAGAADQLRALTDILKVPLQVADGPKTLDKMVRSASAKHQVVIDTGGGNPFDPSEMQSLAALVEVSSADPVMVMAAGGDIAEASDLAEAFADIGADRLAVTRLDMARRLGSILVAAEAARLRLSDVSISPNPADDLKPLTPVTLARLMMPDMVTDSQSAPRAKKRLHA